MALDTNPDESGLVDASSLRRQVNRLTDLSDFSLTEGRIVVVVTPVDGFSLQCSNCILWEKKDRVDIDIVILSLYMIYFFTLILASFCVCGYSDCEAEPTSAAAGGGEQGALQAGGGPVFCYSGVLAY